VVAFVFGTTNATSSDARLDLAGEVGPKRDAMAASTPPARCRVRGSRTRVTVAS
jgi:hypothetical protein